MQLILPIDLYNLQRTAWWMPFLLHVALIGVIGLNWGPVSSISGDRPGNTCYPCDLFWTPWRNSQRDGCKNRSSRRHGCLFFKTWPTHRSVSPFSISWSQSSTSMGRKHYPPMSGLYVKPPITLPCSVAVYPRKGRDLWTPFSSLVG